MKSKIIAIHIGMVVYAIIQASLLVFNAEGIVKLSPFWASSPSLLLVASIAILTAVSLIKCIVKHIINITHK
ncbi:MAG: hypothetical protein CL843_16290 [Crocinitomicaceae bacterium]|nr:hypothetical protein [Crocinitomicaceae bacterium]|tara:strand:+ start:747 stop:962 length:216 start_codon:yes stop_codon:yes gene_type:complete